MNRNIESNQVTICGEIASEFNYSHEVFGEKFYMVDVMVRRISGAFDIIPVTVSERIFNVTGNSAGLFIRVTGQFRSYNKHNELKNKLILSVFATEVEIVDEAENDCENNQIYLEGHICKEPVCRITPLGREIADLLLAVNRPYGKSDYLPCICWGRNARYVGNFGVGERLAICGRIQSREYTKKFEDGSCEQRVAYEVSVSKLEVLEDEKESN